MDLTQAIHERRSIRKFKPDAVSDDLVNAILEAGRWAPSWANTQCGRFVVVRDAQIRTKIADTVPSANPAANAVRIAPVTIVVCAELGKSGFYKEPMTDKGDWYMFDTALAIQNMVLTAHSIGLGTVIMGVFDASMVARILAVPANFKVVTMFPLGYPSENPRAPRRKELSETAFKDRYGAV